MFSLQQLLVSPASVSRTETSRYTSSITLVTNGGICISICSCKPDYLELRSDLIKGLGPKRSTPNKWSRASDGCLIPRQPPPQATDENRKPPWSVSASSVGLRKAWLHLSNNMPGGMGSSLVGNKVLPRDANAASFAIPVRTGDHDGGSSRETAALAVYYTAPEGITWAEKPETSGWVLSLAPWGITHGYIWKLRHRQKRWKTELVNEVLQNARGGEDIICVCCMTLARLTPLVSVFHSSCIMRLAWEPIILTTAWCKLYL